MMSPVESSTIINSLFKTKKPSTDNHVQHPISTSIRSSVFCIEQLLNKQVNSKGQTQAFHSLQNCVKSTNDFESNSPKNHTGKTNFIKVFKKF